MKTCSYETDFYQWLLDQATLMKTGQFTNLDIENIIEEIEALGRSDKRALSSQLIVLLTHLLKLKYQPDGQGNSKSWNSSVINSTREIKFILNDSPSLKNELIKTFPNSYKEARYIASIETELDLQIFPEECPWTIEQVLNEEKK